MGDLSRKIDALSRRTVANGCTAAEAAAAQEKLRELRKRYPLEAKAFTTREAMNNRESKFEQQAAADRAEQRTRERVRREQRRQNNFSTAHSTLIDEVRRRRGVKTRAEAEAIVNEMLEKLLNVAMQQKRRGREVVWVATERKTKQQ
jgi:hypothetical protein